VEFFDSVDELQYLYETEDAMMVDENPEKLTTGVFHDHVEKWTTHLTGVNGGPE